MVAGGLVAPATAITSGTASPGGIPAGTTTLIWYSPIAPGARPANSTMAGWPPRDTVTGLAVKAFLDEHTYRRAQKVSREDMEQLSLDPHDVRPQWNYALRPRRVRDR